MSLLEKLAEDGGSGDTGGGSPPAGSPGPISSGGSSGNRSYDITHKKKPRTGVKLLSPPRGPWDRRRRKTAAFDEGVKTAASKMPITTKEREMFKSRHPDPGCSLGSDKNGFYVYTHRARSKSYASPDSIPVSAVKFIESTG